MDNSLSKVNQISHLATKSVDENKINLLQKQSDNDLGIVADQFESIFVYQMLKQARDSKLSDALFSSDEEDNFGTMLDQERSRSLALNLDLGIAEALVRQFDKNKND